MIIFCTLLSLVVLSILFIFRNKPTNKQQLPSSFSIPTSEQLQYFRTIGDELSDRVVFAMEQHPKTIKDFLGMVLTCSSNDELGQACQQFVRESYKVPEWVDRERIRVAQDFYLRNMTAAGTSGFASLIESYTFADGAKVLTRLVDKSQIMKRMFETQHLVTCVCGYGDCTTPTSEGFQAALRVRLLHSAVRKYVMKRGTWNTEQHGYVACQEDMSHTVLLMSRSYIKGMERLGTVMTQYEQDAYIHLWRFIGHVMGTDDKLLVDTLQDADALWDAICKHSQKIDETSLLLTRSNMDAIHLQPLLFMPSFVMQQVARHILNNDKISDQLQLAQMTIPVTMGLAILRTCTTAWCYLMRYIPPLAWLTKLQSHFLLKVVLANRTMFGFSTSKNVH